MPIYRSVNTEEGGGMVDSPSSPGATARVVSILKSDAVGKIDFFCLGIHINKEFFDIVLRKLESSIWTHKPITVFVDSGVGNKDAFAEYNPASDELTMRSFQALTVNDRAYVIHECVHAALDKTYVKLPYYAQEVLAYLAGASFAFWDAAPDFLYPPKEWSSNNLYMLAWRIAATTESGGTITWEDYVALKAAVLSRSIYRNLANHYGEEGSYKNDG
jgi:hypothetical protein